MVRVFHQSLALLVLHCLPPADTTILRIGNVLFSSMLHEAIWLFAPASPELAQSDFGPLGKFHTDAVIACEPIFPTTRKVELRL